MEKLYFYLPYVIDDQETQLFISQFKEQLTYFNKSQFEINNDTERFVFKKTFSTKINKQTYFKRYNIAEFWLENVIIPPPMSKRIEVYFNNHNNKLNQDLEIITSSPTLITKNITPNQPTSPIIVIFKKNDKDYVYKSLINIFSFLLK